VKGCSTVIITNGNFNQFSRSVDPGIFWAVIKFTPCWLAFLDHSAAEQWKSVDIYSILRHCTYSEVINQCLAYLQTFHSWRSSVHWKSWNSLFMWIRINDHFVPAIFNILATLTVDWNFQPIQWITRSRNALCRHQIHSLFASFTW